MFPSIDELKRLNRNFIDIPDFQIQELLDALKMKDFEWQNEEKYFFNTELDKAIEVSGLHYFDARSINEDWGNKDFIKSYTNSLFLTKFIFGGIPILVIISIILLISGAYLNAGILFLFTIIIYFLVENARKYYYSDNKKGIKPSIISSVLIFAWIINLILLLIATDKSSFSFLLLILSLATLLFFFKIKE